MRPENLCCGFDRTRYIEKTDLNVPTGCSRDHAGVMPKILKIMREYTDIPLIAGGLLSDKKDVMAAFEAGTDAISATNEAVWYVCFKT